MRKLPNVPKGEAMYNIWHCSSPSYYKQMHEQWASLALGESEYMTLHYGTWKLIFMKYSSRAKVMYCKLSSSLVNQGLSSKQFNKDHKLHYRAIGHFLKWCYTNFHYFTFQCNRRASGVDLILLLCETES